ncbi:MAG: hypothetical protein AAF711_16895, partial [Planctomycetota bacterium]
ELAALTLAENAASLFIVIEMLEGLPPIEITSQTEPALVQLVDVLALASDQRRLSRETHDATPEQMADLLNRQNDLVQRCDALAQAGALNERLTAAHKHLVEAATAFESSDKKKLVKAQQGADTLLRHFIIEQSVVLNTKIPPPVASGAPGDNPEGSDTEAAVTSGFIADFVSGETPEDQNSELKVLGERNRAALNQNFARELPLEYRALLKDYYERLAR